MPAPWFLSARIILLPFLSFPEQPPHPSELVVRRAEVAIRYSVHSQGDPKKVVLTTLVPQDIAAFQDIESLSYEPKPAEVFDRDGQRYARFVLVKPGEETLIEIRAKVRLECDDIESLRARKKSATAGAPVLDGDEKKRALRSESFIESDDLGIRKLAVMLPGKEKSEIDRAKAALEITLSQLSPAPYNSSDIGARRALLEKRGDCTEYSDLYAAVLRADQIPARRAYGFLIESGSTPKHDWVEVFLDDLGWVAIDPLHVARGAATFERLKPIYLRMSTLRNDENLSNFHYFVYRNEGGSVQVDDEFRVLSESRDAATGADGASTPPGSSH